MKHYFQTIMERLQSQEDTAVTPGNHHHLFLLGTGVNYVHRPTDPKKDTAYIRGETFSYAAQLTSDILGENESIVRHEKAHVPGDEHYAHPYHSSSVDIINGADTPGYEVGDRLAKALLVALQAIAEGKTTLHINGFSRGGVESIVLTHELQRIKEALALDAKAHTESKRSLAAIIADSHSVPQFGFLETQSYTKLALASLIPDQSTMADNETLLKATLLQQLNALEVHLFVLDPVPGGNFGKVVRIGWQEADYFYSLPEFVVKRQEFVHQHETSNCFKPIVPLGMPYEVLPGCHGTGDGNQFDHNGLPVPNHFKNRDLSGVQDLVLSRWIDFTFGSEPLEHCVDLGHPALDKVSNEYLKSDEREQNQILLTIYSEIKKNYPAFEWLATRNYTGLGRYLATRQVHFHQRGNTPITDLDVHGAGKFLNLQHVQLWMSQGLQHANFFEKTLFEQIQWLQKNFENGFQTQDLNSAPEDLMVKTLLDQKEHHALLKESLSFLIGTIAQVYLRNHLSFEEGESCRACVLQSFSVLEKAAKVESDIQTLAQALLPLIKKDLTSTLLLHQDALLAVSQQWLDLQAKYTVSFEKPTEESAVAWLVNAQKSFEDLELLCEHIQKLADFSDEAMLIESWQKYLPNFNSAQPVSGADGADIDAMQASIFLYINQQKKLLLLGAAELLENMPHHLAKQPDYIEPFFYQEVYKLAAAPSLQKQYGDLEQQHREAITAIQKENESLQRHVKTLQSPEQRQATVQVELLKAHCTAYLSHLNNAKSPSPLLEEKKKMVTRMQDILKTTALPSTQLQAFKQSLEDNSHTLKAHRDPAWQRFFRDCLRILAVAFSGLGLYRLANGQSPNFFKPSQGAEFVEAVSKPLSETKPHAKIVGL